MARLRRYLVPAFLLLPVLLICSKLLLTPIEQPLVDRHWFDKFYVLDVGAPPQDARGWPWVFLKTVTTSGWPPRNAGTHIIYFSPWRLVGDVAIFSLVLAAAAAILMWHRRRRGAWLRFSLREVFAVTTVIAAGLGWWMYHDTIGRREQQTIKRLNAENCQGDLNFPPYHGPEWLRRLWPDEKLTNFHHVTYLVIPRFRGVAGLRQLRADVASLPQLRTLTLGQWGPAVASSNLVQQDDPSLGDASSASADPAAFDQIDFLTISGSVASDELVERLGDMRNLTRLTIDGGAISDLALKQVATWKSLEHLEIYRPLRAKYVTTISDSGIAHLAELPRLRFIWLSSLDITDATLKLLGQLPELEAIGVGYCSQITDAGVEALVKLPRIKWLYLSYTNITDAALEGITKMRSLETLELTECRNLSDPAIRRLLELPNLKQLNPPAQISEETLNRLKSRIKTVIVN